MSYSFFCLFVCLFVLFCFVFSTSVVTIGFNGSYFVREDAGVISIVVLVLMKSLARDVEATLSATDGTARGRLAPCLTCMDRC